MEGRVDHVFIVRITYCRDEYAFIRIPKRALRLMRVRPLFAKITVDPDGRVSIEPLYY